MTKNTINMPGKTFKEFFGAVSLVSDDCRLHIENGRLYVRTVDTANVMLIDISADIGNTGNAGVVLGLNTSDIRCVSKFVQDTDQVTISWELQESSMYRVLIETETHIIDMISIDTGCIRKDATPPTVTYRASFTTRLQKLADFAGISEKCRISVKDDVARLTAWFGDNNNRIGTVIGPATGEASTLYSIDYLKRMAKAFPEQSATIEMSMDSIMKATLHTGQINVMWMLAPRIEAE